MSWRDGLRKASFRGVAFHYSEAAGDFGRRLARHDYPGRDVPFMEDMGRKAREHTIQAYVLEPDHLTKAARLIEACEKIGPGTLVHPYLGERRVVCTTCRQRFTTADGGMATIALTFIEAGDNRFPVAKADTARQVNLAADDALKAVRAHFEETFNVGGHPGFVANHAAETARLAANDISAALGTAMDLAQGRAAFARDVAALKADAAALVGDPKSLAMRLTNLAGLPSSLGVAPQVSVYSKLSSFGATLPTVPLRTPSRRAQAGNQSALIGLVGRIGLIEQARAAARQSFASRQEATDARDDLIDRIDGDLASAPDPLYRTFGALGQALVRHISAVAPSLARVIKHVTTTTRPALVIAHDLYGDAPSTVAARAAEIASRNRLRHPGMAAGGAVLEVLSNG